LVSIFSIVQEIFLILLPLLRQIGVIKLEVGIVIPVLAIAGISVIPFIILKGFFEGPLQCQRRQMDDFKKATAFEAGDVMASPG
jgi:hypothetical protein